MNHASLLKLASALLLLFPLALKAQDAEPRISLVDAVNADSVNLIIVPPALGERLEYHEPKKPTRPADSRAGFRVQIFLDGNQTTARNSARARIRQVSARFPQYRTYLDYKSPYWRAKVGDFKSREEANEAAAQIRRSFPGFSKEVRVVADRISILEQP